MPRVAHSISVVYSLRQRLRSLRHRFWYGVSKRVRWSRGAHCETPVRELPALAFEQAQRITTLRDRYQVQFELKMNSETSRNNYEYLDILDRAWAGSGLSRPCDAVVCDVGCASFWYAATLQAFFRPRELVGVEVEGHRLYRDGHTRIDYASGYVADIPAARFVVADYTACELPADVITLWFPFVTPAAILAWRLPLSLLTPARLFARIYHNLRPDGVLVMVNHGHQEAELANRLCVAADLKCLFRFAEPGPFSAYRGRPAVLSCWARGQE
jgi:SAM-dependent methyltransferase